MTTCVHFVALAVIPCTTKVISSNKLIHGLPILTHFPDALEPRRYYEPVPRGLEAKLRETLERIREGAALRAHDEGRE